MSEAAVSTGTRSARPYRPAAWATERLLWAGRHAWPTSATETAHVSPHSTRGQAAMLTPSPLPFLSKSSDTVMHQHTTYTTALKGTHKHALCSRPTHRRQDSDKTPYLVQLKTWHSLHGGADLRASSLGSSTRGSIHRGRAQGQRTWRSRQQQPTRAVVRRRRSPHLGHSLVARSPAHVLMERVPGRYPARGSRSQPCGLGLVGTLP